MSFFGLRRRRPTGRHAVAGRVVGATILPGVPVSTAPHPRLRPPAAGIAAVAAVAPAPLPFPSRPRTRRRRVACGPASVALPRPVEPVSLASDRPRPPAEQMPPVGGGARPPALAAAGPSWTAVVEPAVTCRSRRTSRIAPARAWGCSSVTAPTSTSMPPTRELGAFTAIADELNR